MKSEWSYLIYIVFWESLTIGGSAFAVFVLDAGGWWILAGIIISFCAYPPGKWSELYNKPKELP